MQQPDKRTSGLGNGATAGLAVGIAVSAILVIGMSILFILHVRQRKHYSNPLYSDKYYYHSNTTATATLTNSNSSPAHDIEMTTNTNTTLPPPHRQKSLKDRLKGPLYHDKLTDPIPAPQAAYIKRERTEMYDSDDGTISGIDLSYDYDFIGMGDGSGDGSKSKRDTVNSYSSKRATRLMMMA